MLLVLGLRPAPARAQAPNVAYNGPITITSGGTYSGNYRSTDSNTPVIRIATSDPVIIENCILAGAGDIIWANNGGANLTIRNNQAYGLTPSQDGVGRGRFVAASSARNIQATNNYLEHTTGFTIYQWTGDGSASQTIKILRNKVNSIDGRHRNNSSFTMANFVGLNQVRNVAGIEIAWNQVINEADNSMVEDNINFYNSGGTSGSRALVHNNYIQGAYMPNAVASNYSGTGMTTDGDGSSASTTTSYLDAYQNQFVSTGNSAMNIAAGHDVRYFNNRIVTSGLLPDGRRLMGTYCGASIFNAYQQPSSVMYNNSIDNNVIGYVKWGYSSPYADRHDLSTGACSNCTNTTHLPNPITIQTEQNEWTLWQQKLSQNGITLGVGGSGGTTAPAPAPAPTPTPTPAPAPTPSTPAPTPANATFYRAININGGALTLDGHSWEAGNSAANLSMNGTGTTASALALNPATDATRAELIRSFRYANAFDVRVGGVPSGTYAVYLYVVENMNAKTYSITLEGQSAQSNYNSGAPGTWRRLGPFTAAVTDGTLNLATTGDYANLSGIEIWQEGSAAPANQAPTVSLAAATASLTVNTALNLTATAADADGTVSKVEFFSGATKLGEDTSAPFSLSFTPTVTGTLSLTARATDNAGATTTSAPVSVAVTAAPAPAPSTPLTGPAGATFYRGININGPAVTLDGNAWQASAGAANLSVTGTSFSNPSSTLSPATDATRAGMLTSAVGGSTVGATLSAVPNGTYSVYAYVWEDNAPETTSLVINGTTVRAGYNTGAAGHWERLGPFQVNVTGGSIALSTSGGHPNLSGVEVWQHSTTPAPAPAPTRTLFRAVNLNGAATTIDGLSYEAGTSAANISTNGGRLATPNVTLVPATDAARAAMLRSFVWGNNLRLTVQNVPNGTYEVAYYVFEDNAAETYSLTANGQAVLTNYNSGPAGTWRKTTPVRLTVTNGQITLQSSGNGHVNVSGLEIFRVQ